MTDDKKPGPVCSYLGASRIDAGARAGLFSPKSTTSGHQVSGPQPGGSPLTVEAQLQEASTRRDWRQVQIILAAVADGLAGDLAIPFGKSVFYAGGLGEQAKGWAHQNGRMTIDMTVAGRTLARLIEPIKEHFRWVEDLRPAWTRLSGFMATQAGGEVHAFVRGRKTGKGVSVAPNEVRMPKPPAGGERRAIVRGAGSVFWEIEYPELTVLKPLRANKNVKQITFHVYNASDKRLGTVTESPKP